MITSLAQIITGFLHKNERVESDKLDIYIYGYEIAISNFIIFSIAIIMGFIFSQFIESVIYLIVFSIMRKYCGGYHAETYLKCNLIFVLSTFVIMMFIKIVIYYPIYIHLLLSVFVVVSVIWLAPVENKYKSLTDKEKKKHRITAILCCSGFIILSTMLYYMFFKYHAVIDMTLLIVSISMIIESILKEGVKREKC